MTWPRRPRPRGPAGGRRATSTRSSTPWRSANKRSRSAVGRQPREVDAVDELERAAALDARQVEQLVDHLDEVAGLDLDLADPVAHPIGIAIFELAGLARQRLGQQADRRERRPELVRQVVDELRPDPLEPAQLGDVLEEQPRAARRRASTREDDQGRPVGARGLDLGPRGADVDRRRGRSPRRSCRGTPPAPSADQRPRRAPEERMGDRVGLDDLESGPTVMTPRADGLQEVVASRSLRLVALVELGAKPRRRRPRSASGAARGEPDPARAFA